MTQSEGSSDLVWYAGYGSNLLAERFLAYMQGGRPPNAPEHVVESGARDSTPPRAEICVEIDYGISFGGDSRRWGGGVAFIDPRPGSGQAFVRAYLVTVEQLEDLHRQENSAAEVRPADLARLIHNGSQRLHDAHYPNLLVGATHSDGRPIVVIAGDEPPPPTVPGIAYLRTMAQGLETDFGLSRTQIANYLCSRPGAHGSLDATSVAADIWATPEG